MAMFLSRRKFVQKKNQAQFTTEEGGKDAIENAVASEPMIDFTFTRRH